MERGTTLFYLLGRSEPIGTIVPQIHQFFLNAAPIRHKVTSSGFSYGMGDRYFRVSSMEELLRVVPQGARRIDVWYRVEDAKRSYAVYFAERFLTDGVATGFQVNLPADLWPGFLVEGLRNRSLEETLRDYRLAKELFRFVDAERCLGSILGEYYPIDDPDADQVLSFSRQGPQKLVWPLEEGRFPVEAWQDRSRDDYEIDPLTGLPKWSRLVHMPFRELPDSAGGAA